MKRKKRFWNNLLNQSKTLVKNTGVFLIILIKKKQKIIYSLKFEKFSTIFHFLWKIKR